VVAIEAARVRRLEKTGDGGLIGWRDMDGCLWIGLGSGEHKIERCVVGYGRLCY